MGYRSGRGGFGVEAAGDEETGVGRGVSGVGVRCVGRQGLRQGAVVRFGVGVQFAAGFEEAGAEGYVAVYVLGFKARPLRGEAVGEAEDGELLAEGAGGAGEPVGRVVGAGVLHKADLEVQGGQGRGEVGVGGRDAEAAADPAHEDGAQGVVGDEEDPPLELAAGDGLGDVVEERREAQPPHAPGKDAGAEAPQLQLLLDAADDLQDVVKGVEVVVRAALEAPGQGELGHRL